jgi:hypothetical protein
MNREEGSGVVVVEVEVGSGRGGVDQSRSSWLALSCDWSWEDESEVDEDEDEEKKGNLLSASCCLLFADSDCSGRLEWLLYLLPLFLQTPTTFPLLSLLPPPSSTFPLPLLPTTASISSTDLASIHLTTPLPGAELA